MEQGKIDQILSSKPEDRRYLFEEAAGISRSKTECAEAERELEKTRQNMVQIEIAMNEIITGERPEISDIRDMCKCEKIDNPDGSRRMGFCL